MVFFWLYWRYIGIEKALEGNLIDL